MKYFGVASWFLLLFCMGAAQNSQEGDFDSVSKRAATLLSSDPAGAAILYRQSVALRPDWAEGWFYLGTSLFETGRFADSKEALRKAAELAPKRGTVWAFLGLTENQLGESVQALADIRKGEAIGLADDMKFIAAVRDTAALICIQAGDYSGAVAQLRDLARIGARSAATIDELGVSVLGMPMLTATASKSKRDLVNEAGEAAWALYAQKINDADTKLKKLLAGHPNEPGVHYLYGIYLLGRDKDAARIEFSKELRLAPGRVAARLQLAILDIQEGNPQDADKLGREASKLDTQNPLAYLIIGRAMLQEERFSDALPALHAAARLSPENAEAHLYLGQAYRHLGRSSEAQHELSEFERLKAASDPTVYSFQPDSTSKVQ